LVLSLPYITTLGSLKKKLADQPELSSRNWTLKGALGSLQSCNDDMNLEECGLTPSAKLFIQFAPLKKG
jgi:hypothetical protein